MRPPIKYIFSTLLTIHISILFVYGQKEQDVDGDLSGNIMSKETNIPTPATDSTGIYDTLQIPIIHRIELSFDYSKLVSFALPNEVKAEGGVSIITKPNIGINLEFGYGEKMPEEHYRNADYKVSGLYGRAGLSYHHPFNPGTNFIIGARYGLSNYQDEATFSIESSLWNPYVDSFKRTDLSARWVEFILGSESKFKGNFYFGFIFRFRALISHDNFSPLEVFSIPGYGRTIDKTIPALNLYIKYMINFRK